MLKKSKLHQSLVACAIRKISKITSRKDKAHTIKQLKSKFCFTALSVYNMDCSCILLILILFSPLALYQ